MKSLLVATLMLFSLVANAADEYRGYLVAPGTVGAKDQSFNIDIKFEVTPDGMLAGNFKSWQSGPCRGDRAIQGTLKGDEIYFKTDKHELKGCGRNWFKGVKEGDTFVGKMFFQGADRDITFKKM